MKSNLLKLFTVFGALLIVLSLTDTAFAQRRGGNYTKAQFENIIARVEERVDNFVGRIDKSLDNSRLDGSRREDNINARAGDLERATDELRREFDRRDRWIENRDEVRRCLNIANDLNRVMTGRRFNRQTEENWNRVRYELNTLAKAFNLPNVGSDAYR